MSHVKLFGSSRSAAYLSKSRCATKTKKPLKTLAIILAIVLCLEGLYFFAAYTNNSFVSYWRNVYINTALSTMRHQWLATKLLPKDVVQAVIDHNTAAAEALEGHTSTWGDAEPDTSRPIGVEIETPAEPTPEEIAAQEQAAFYELYWELDVPTFEAYLQEHPETLDNGWSGIYINEAGIGDQGTSIYTTMGEQVLAIDVPNQLLLVRIQGSGYRGVLAIGKDPSRLCVGVSNNISQGDDPFSKGDGQRVGEIAQGFDGVLAIPANGFIDIGPTGAVGDGNGGRISGYTMSQGTEYNVNYHARNTGWHKFMRLELHENNLMYIKNVNDPVSEACTDAVEFEPPMIIDGQVLVSDWWTELNPRACIGQSDKYEILMLMIEGRRPLEGILGTDINVCADILKQHNCMQALNVDGGTSGMMWYNGEYVTRCSNPNLPEGRKIPNAWVYRTVSE